MGKFEKAVWNTRVFFAKHITGSLSGDEDGWAGFNFRRKKLKGINPKVKMINKIHEQIRKDMEKELTQGDIKNMCKQKARNILHELDADFNINIDEFDVKLENYLTDELFRLAINVRDGRIKGHITREEHARIVNS